MIDLRSDTVTKPTKPMLEAMMAAEVGDFVLGDDPTVIELQEYAANLSGKEAALFVASGTMANQIALRYYAQPGGEVIIESLSHVIHFESGAAAMSGLQFNVIHGEKAVVPLESVMNAVRGPAYYMPRTALIWLEDTSNNAGGTIYPLEEVQKLSAFARKNNIPLHLDGARVFNRCVATNVRLKDYVKHYDSFSFCLSKGLGAPIGSVLCGSKTFIEEALRWQRIMGGGWRQAGYLAAAGYYALTHNVDRLKTDHQNAKFLAEIFNDIPDFEANPDEVQTNIVMVKVDPNRINPYDLMTYLKTRDVLILPLAKDKIRFVVHMQVSRDDIETAASYTREFRG